MQSCALAADRSGLTVAASLLLHLSSVQWLAKDIIWITPDSTCEPLTALQVSQGLQWPAALTLGGMHSTSSHVRSRVLARSR